MVVYSKDNNWSGVPGERLLLGTSQVLGSTASLLGDGRSSIGLTANYILQASVSKARMGYISNGSRGTECVASRGRVQTKEKAV